jgi:hypothetical protein
VVVDAEKKESERKRKRKTLSGEKKEVCSKRARRVPVLHIYGLRVNQALAIDGLLVSLGSQRIIFQREPKRDVTNRSGR